ncbi:MAG TPA: hypothetical protein VH023_07650 [Rhodopila sp.]|nr:hypothetical protein [Rhodopila sp.]
MARTNGSWRRCEIAAPLAAADHRLQFAEYDPFFAASHLVPEHT